ncbi:hypothetical protein QYE76_032057 [Lolium multiflorum]|uniref:Uncharacterized protein n=1 Tax=Lolium multiflorum TaxID=4521 RepID=A0AAD8QW43_LOLMU|nr:hypothetical protein QYE76_032057 [Lolium multiflorum]
MIVTCHEASTQGEETLIEFVDHMIATAPNAPTQYKENSIDMLFHMSVLNKKKHHTMTAINMIAMPTMGVMTNPTTTSSSTWTRCLIVSNTLMLMIKVINNNLGVIFGIIHGKTTMEEEIRQLPKMRKPSMDVVKNLHNLVKIFANTIIEHQVKLVFECITNPPQAAREEGIRPH